MTIIKKYFGSDNNYDLIDDETEVMSSVEEPSRHFPDGGWVWFLNDVCHREDGPAMYEPTHKEQYTYYVNGEVISRELFILRYEMIYLKEYTGI